MCKTMKTCLSIIIIGLLSISSLNGNLQAINKEDIPEKVALMSSFTEYFHAEEAFAYNERLTLDDFEGRQSGTEENNQSANWIRDQFIEFGLKPFQNTSYFQEFKTPYYEVNSPLSFEVNNSSKTIQMEYRKHFVVYPYSGSGMADSQVVFAGFGITDEESQYDDYDKTQVKGKTVFILNGWPSFVAVHTYDGYNTRYKIKNAFEHGAVGVILSPRPTDAELVPMNMKFASGYSCELPCLYVNKNTAPTFFENNQVTLTSLLKSIEETKKPQSIPLPVTVSFEVHTTTETRNTNNVIGYLPALDPDSEESIVIGAHYDHLGKDQITGDIFRGANDNASGTAVMLELASALSELPIALKTNIVFIAFSGEEEGLVGSQFYVKNPLFPLKKMRAMINLDMVGTGEGVLYAGTSSTLYPELSETIQESAVYKDLNIVFNANLLYPGSDHYPFHMNKVPSVFFFQDNPTDIGGYHTLKDTMDSISQEDLGSCGNIAILTTLILSDAIWMEINEPKTLPKHPRMKLTGTVFGLEDTSYILKIGDYELLSDSYEPFEAFLPLQSGDNTFEFLITTEEETVVKKFSYLLKAEVDQNLIADFNQDLTVNLKDLTLFARYYGMNAPSYQFRSQFDCNLDKIIDAADMKILNSVWGYVSK
ncbi:MAG: M28 family peptidase [Caldisericia bacterium]|nr:M28 family peptidase [Caldisericia bacterium]